MDSEKTHGTLHFSPKFQTPLTYHQCKILFYRVWITDHFCYFRHLGPLITSWIPDRRRISLELQRFKDKRESENDLHIT